MTRVVSAIAGFVALLVVLGMAGGWPVPLTFVAILLMVLAHEWGHFVTARRAGMIVTDFFVGFGPLVWATTKGETRYGVRLFPLGGYVKVPGMTSAEVVDPALEVRTYRASSTARQIIFASAGSFMHMVVAILLAVVSLSVFGRVSPHVVEISSLSRFDGITAPATAAHLRVGDRIHAVDGVTVSSMAQFISRVHDDVRSGSVTLTLERDGRRWQRTMPVLDGCHLRLAGQVLSPRCGTTGFIGVGLTNGVSRDSFWRAWPDGVVEVGRLLGASIQGIGHLFSPPALSHLVHQVVSPSQTGAATDLSRPQSVVGVVRLAAEGTSVDGVRVLFSIFISLNVFVGVMNMLPLLPLDGGYVAIALYERLRSRPGRRYRADVAKLTPLVVAFIGVLGVIFAGTLYLDIAHPLVNPFR